MPSHQSPITSHQSSPILLFDGVCNLCNASVQWVIGRDKRAVFRFASLQSETGQAFLRKYKLSESDLDTVVLIDGDRAYTRSDVGLRIFDKLGGAWHLLKVFYIVPRPVRNWVYDWIAKNRYRWFGKQESCMMPAEELRGRFLA